MATYFGLMRKGQSLAQKKGLEKTAVKSLLLFASNLSATDIYISINKEAPKEVEEKFYKLLDEYINSGRPVQYIIGHTYFYGYKIIVNEDVLIPRWETEELASNILIYYDRYFKGEKVKVIDIGTGSGAIAIALAKEEPNMTLKATDISKEALDVARENAKINNCDIKFQISDMLNDLADDEIYDIIVSNPPYLMNNEYVEPIVKDNEPHVALFGGEDGLHFYRILLRDALKHINKNHFMIAFEHGYDKKDELNKLIREYYEDAEIINLKDSAGLDRMTFIIK
ncbi:MAG: peptide chain release factor N(5)-glutamine methyltransferase [Gammaproteobacteria bacterium]|nr:peptide chain release factor N(5)-glutamine methyltransferase [Gammaproteobacteria bacterium]